MVFEAPPADELNRRADEILARPEFLPPSRTLMERILDWIGDQISDVIGTEVPGGSLIGWLLLGAILTALVVLVVRVAPRRLRVASQSKAAVSVLDGGTPRADWLAAAADAQASGDWAEAVRCWYRASVAGLGEKGMVSRSPGAPNSELRQDLATAQSAVGARFDPAATRFEEIYYGGEPAAEADDRRQAQFDDEIMGAAKR